MLDHQLEELMVRHKLLLQSCVLCYDYDFATSPRHLIGSNECGMHASAAVVAQQQCLPTLTQAIRQEQPKHVCCTLAVWCVTIADIVPAGCAEKAIQTRMKHT